MNTAENRVRIARGEVVLLTFLLAFIVFDLGVDVGYRSPGVVQIVLKALACSFMLAVLLGLCWNRLRRPAAAALPALTHNAREFDRPFSAANRNSAPTKILNRRLLSTQQANSIEKN